MREIKSLLALAILAMAYSLPAPAIAAIAPEGLKATYRRESAADLRATDIDRFTLSFGPTEKSENVDSHQWISLRATKKNGERFAVWILSDQNPFYPIGETVRRVDRFIVQEGATLPKEYVHKFTNAPVLPSLGAWEYLWPTNENPELPLDLPAETSPQRVDWLGHRYLLDSKEESQPFELPPAPRRIALLPDALIGVPSNSRTRDSVRRYDGSDYEMIRLTREDYAEMIAAGMNCLRVDAEQAQWLKNEPVFYWGIGGADVLFPECLYNPAYLGPTIHIDEPAVATRDYVMRPKLEKDPALRRALTPQMMLDAFKDKYSEAARGATGAFMAGLKARADVDIGSMDLTLRNLYAWETMIASAAWQLTAESPGPRAIVFEPPGRIGTRRTLPEMSMAYGCQLRTDDPNNLLDIIVGFARGAARAAGKDWGISIYGAVDRDDAPVWLTRSYDLGAKYFFFWDNYQSACVPYEECIALSRHLSAHIAGRPARDHDRLRNAAEVAILIPPGYDLGHTRMGRGELWGLGELNLERKNREGVSYRKVMGAFFAEIERCSRLGVTYDAMWDLPYMGFFRTDWREIVRIREDGRVEVGLGGEKKLLDGPRIPKRPDGAPPTLEIEVTRDSARHYVARARIVEGAAPIYYTTGADRRGVYHNAMVLWELFGPEEEDCRWLQSSASIPKISREGKTDVVEIKFEVAKPGRYRLRAATCDLAGRTAVAWKEIEETE